MGQMQALGITGSKMDEVQAQLKQRLSGADGEGAADDQLFGAASNLSQAEYKKFM